MRHLPPVRDHLAPPDSAARPPGMSAPGGCEPCGSSLPLFRGGSLGDTLRRLNLVVEPRSAIVGAPSGDGWLHCADLAAPEMIDGAIALLQTVQGSSPEVAASYYLGWYAASVAGPAVVCFAVSRRVPSLQVSRMSLHLNDDGWFDVTALSETGTAVLPDDPLVGGDGLVVVADDVHALRTHLAAEVVGHLEPLVEALRARVRLGRPALWGTVSAQCARAFLLTERVSGDPFAGRTEADAFFAVACPPIRARPTWHEFAHRGRQHVGMRRASCCLAHRLTSSYCTTCPFTSTDERDRRLREWVDAQGDGGLAV